MSKMVFGVCVINIWACFPMHKLAILPIMVDLDVDICAYCTNSLWSLPIHFISGRILLLFLSFETGFVQSFFIILNLKQS